MPDPILDFAWPLHLVPGPNGSTVLATVEQDTPEDVQRGLALVCEIRVGDLEWDETLGIPDPNGTTDPDLAAGLIGAALRAVDPRPADIRVDVVDRDDGRNLHLKVTPT